MARPFEELLEGFTPERRARVRRRTEEMLAELRLREVRAACEMTQQELAERLNIDRETCALWLIVWAATSRSWPCFRRGRSGSRSSGMGRTTEDRGPPLAVSRYRDANSYDRLPVTPPG